MYQAGGFQKDEIVKVNKVIYTGQGDTESGLILKIYEWGKKNKL